MSFIPPHVVETKTFEKFAHWDMDTPVNSSVAISPLLKASGVLFAVKLFPVVLNTCAPDIVRLFTYPVFSTIVLIVDVPEEFCRYTSLMCIDAPAQFTASPVLLSTFLCASTVKVLSHENTSPEMVTDMTMRRTAAMSGDTPF